MTTGRSLHRERGLKPPPIEIVGQVCASLPSPGAWIETSVDYACGEPFGSLPSPGAWIETYDVTLVNNTVLVAPFTGSVD